MIQKLNLLKNKKIWIFFKKDLTFMYIYTIFLTNQTILEEIKNNLSLKQKKGGTSLRNLGKTILPSKRNWLITKKNTKMKKIITILFLLVLLVSSFIFASCEMMMKNASNQAQEEINSEVATTASPDNVTLPRHRKNPTEAVDSLASIIRSAINPSDSSAISALDSLTLYGQGTEVLLWLQWEVLERHIMQSSDYQDTISAIHLKLREVQKALETGEYEKAQNLLDNVLKM